jgi:predicted dehydrogenase
MINIAVIGYGYWGPRVARNFYTSGQTHLHTICDQRPESLQKAHEDYPDVATTTDPLDVLTSTAIDAVAIVTPVWTHFDFAKLALENGKHVWVEKPFTLSTDQASELIDLAASKHLTIMVDHTFLFTGAVKKIRELVDDSTLGSLYYYDSTRVNLGLFQHDVNVVWDLAPHDLSIMDFLIRKEPEALTATGQIHLNGFEDMAYITIFYPDKLIAHISVNWLSPVKMRTTLLGGEKKMLVWNDLEADEKIRVYDKGVSIDSHAGVYDLLVSYRSGDMWAPKVEQTEALRAEARYFADCISNSKTPINDGIAGHRVVRLLEAATQSIKNRGKIVEL